MVGSVAWRQGGSRIPLFGRSKLEARSEVFFQHSSILGVNLSSGIDMD